jgi:hypothetical protein
MPRRGPTVVSGGTAWYILERLVAAARVTRDDIARYIAEIPGEILALEARLDRLRKGGQENPATTRATGMQRRTRKGSARAARRSSRPADRKKPSKGKALGGTYGGLIRRVPTADQAQYEAIKRTRGIEAAIDALRARKRP